MKYKVFVYGTLKQGYGNWQRLLEGKSVFLGKAVTVSKYTMLDSGFPVLMESGKRETGNVAGEVYEVDSNVLKHLDRLEGEGSMYDRKLIQIELANADAEAAFIDVHAYIGCPKCWDSRRERLITQRDKYGNLFWGRAEEAV